MKNFLYIFILGLFLILPFKASATVDTDLKPIDANEDYLVNDISSERLSLQSTSDDSGNEICYYEEIAGTIYLQINKGIFDTSNVLMGISNPKFCPLPGSQAFEGYEAAVGSQFLMSGIVCIVQSVVLDSMFRVYCTILLWFYQILYAGIVLYIMFYGMAIMFDLTEEPLKEAPKRFLKVFFILFFAVNAERAFYYIHGGFMNILNGFSDMLTSVQPYYTEDGMIAYSTTETYEDGTPKLLDIDGNVWKAPPADFEYCFADLSFCGAYIPGYAIPDGVETVSEISEYRPFRVPAQQWILDPNNNYKLYPVFQEVASVSRGEKVCIRDVRYDPTEKQLVEYPRCQAPSLDTMPNMAPLNSYCLYDRNTGIETRCLLPIGHILFPPKLMNIPGNGRNGMNELCDEDTPPSECRQPFQSVLGKIDAMFNSIVGQDRIRSIGSMMLALLLWGFGGGALLGIFMMLGIMTMFTAFMQILWTYITAMMALSFMMMLSPIFISFALFDITKKMFMAWLSNLVSYAMQPILVLGFLLVLSSATTLDRLTMLARHEVGTKRMEVQNNGGQTKTEMSAPGFLEPLYEIPPDYNLIIGGRNNGVLSGGTACDSGTQDCGYLTAAQRQAYINKKETELLTAYSLMGHGFSGGLGLSCIGGGTPDYTQKPNFDDVSGCLAYAQAISDPLNPVNQQVSRLTALMNTGEVFQQDVPDPDTPGGNITKDVTLKGIEAVVESGEFPEFVSLYEDELGIPDDDGFLGEGDLDTDYPNWLFGDGNARVTNEPHQEFPRCVKYCPAFVPPYHPVDNANPLVGSCEQFCLYIFENRNDMFAYLMGAVVIWIIMNVIIGAFVSKIPALAQKLSPLDPRASAAGPPKIFGQSQKSYSAPPGSIPQYGKAAFSQEEKYSGMYNMGSFLDVGLTSGTAGSGVAFLDKARRMGMGTKYVVNQQTLERQTTEVSSIDQMLRNNNFLTSPFKQNYSPASMVIASKAVDELAEQLAFENNTSVEEERDNAVELVKKKMNGEDAERLKSETNQSEGYTDRKAQSLSSEVLEEYKEQKRKEEEQAKKQQAGGGNSTSAIDSPYQDVQLRSSSPTNVAALAPTLAMSEAFKMYQDPEFQKIAEEQGVEKATEIYAAEFIEKQNANDNNSGDEPKLVEPTVNEAADYASQPQERTKTLEATEQPIIQNQQATDEQEVITKAPAEVLDTTTPEALQTAEAEKEKIIAKAEAQEAVKKKAQTVQSEEELAEQQEKKTKEELMPDLQDMQDRIETGIFTEEGIFDNEELHQEIEEEFGGEQGLVGDDIQMPTDIGQQEAENVVNKDEALNTVEIIPEKAPEQISAMAMFSKLGQATSGKKTASALPNEGAENEGDKAKDNRSDEKGSEKVDRKEVLGPEIPPEEQAKIDEYQREQQAQAELSGNQALYKRLEDEGYGMYTDEGRFIELVRKFNGDGYLAYKAYMQELTDELNERQKGAEKDGAITLEEQKAIDDIKKDISEGRELESSTEFEKIVAKRDDSQKDQQIIEKTLSGQQLTTEEAQYLNQQNTTTVDAPNQVTSSASNVTQAANLAASGKVQPSAANPLTSVQNTVGKKSIFKTEEQKLPEGVNIAQAEGGDGAVSGTSKTQTATREAVGVQASGSSQQPDAVIATNTVSTSEVIGGEGQLQTQTTANEISENISQQEVLNTAVPVQEALPGEVGTIADKVEISSASQQETIAANEKMASEVISPTNNTADITQPSPIIATADENIQNNNQAQTDTVAGTTPSVANVATPTTPPNIGKLDPSKPFAPQPGQDGKSIFSVDKTETPEGYSSTSQASTSQGYSTTPKTVRDGAAPIGATVGSSPTSPNATADTPLSNTSTNNIDTSVVVNNLEVPETPQAKPDINIVPEELVPQELVKEEPAITQQSENKDFFAAESLKPLGAATANDFEVGTTKSPAETGGFKSEARMTEAERKEEVVRRQREEEEILERAGREQNYVRAGVDNINAQQAPTPEEALQTEPQMVTPEVVEAPDYASQPEVLEAATLEQNSEPQAVAEEGMYDKLKGTMYEQYLDDPLYLEMLRKYGGDEYLALLKYQEAIDEAFKSSKEESPIDDSNKIKQEQAELERVEKERINEEARVTAENQYYEEQQKATEEAASTTTDAWGNNAAEASATSFFAEPEIENVQTGNNENVGAAFSGVDSSGLTQDGFASNTVNQMLYGGSDGTLQDPEQALKETLSNQDSNDQKVEQTVATEEPQAAGDVSVGNNIPNEQVSQNQFVEPTQPNEVVNPLQAAIDKATAEREQQATEQFSQQTSEANILQGARADSAEAINIEPSGAEAGITATDILAAKELEALAVSAEEQREAEKLKAENNKDKKGKKSALAQQLEDMAKTELSFEKFDDGRDEAVRKQAEEELERLLAQEANEDEARKQAEELAEKARLEDEKQDDDSESDSFNQGAYLQLRNMVEAELQTIFDKRFADDDTGRSYIATRQMITNFESDQSFKTQASGSNIELEFRARDIANQLIRTYKTTA